MARWEILGGASFFTGKVLLSEPQGLLDSKVLPQHWLVPSQLASSQQVHSPTLPNPNGLEAFFFNSAKQLSSELQGLSITVGSLERQLLDSESSCDGLRRQLDAGGDHSDRERELSRQVYSTRYFISYWHRGST